MTSIVTNLASKHAKKLISGHAEQYEPENPYYLTYVDNNGKEKRVKRPPPPGLTKQEAKLLRKIQRRAHYLDKGINLCGFRVGWTFFIGLIPGAGDIAAAGLNYCLVLRPSKKGAELPAWIVRQMTLNNAISAGVGLIPFAGDVVLAIWKANSRNAKLLEEFFRVKGEQNIANGLTGLTPYTDERGRKIDHPAQGAARDLALQEQNRAGAAAGSSTTQPTAGQSSGTASGTATPAASTTKQGRNRKN